MSNYIPYVFTKNDIIDDFASEQQYKNWLAKQVYNKRIAKVRRNLYVQVDASNYPLSNKFEIASKITEDAFLCYHSALEYYGIANQVFNVVTVGSEKRFNSFEFNGVEYMHRPIKCHEEILNIVTSSTRVTSLERTIIDCIFDIDTGGGIEEIIYALEQIRYLDEYKLKAVLDAYNSVILYQKVGYLLEQFKVELGLSNEFFDMCASHLTNQVKYFLQEYYADIEYNSKWKLMAPKNLKSRDNGGY